MADKRDFRRLDQPRDPRLRLPRFDPEAFGRWSEAIARFMGTAKFIVYMTAFILIWFAWNIFAPSGMRFDPYTFTFLTLLLSLQASYAAPLILLAQNRQADRDRLAMEEDRRRAAMQKADTEYLAREIASLRVAVGEVATRDFLRSELNRLSEELDQTAERRHKTERKQQRRLAKRQNELADVLTPEEPDDDLSEPLEDPSATNSGRARRSAESPQPAQAQSQQPQSEQAQSQQAQSQRGQSQQPRKARRPQEARRRTP